MLSAEHIQGVSASRTGNGNEGAAKGILDVTPPIAATPLKERASAR